ncbi:MAG TPA: hypothetical protein VN809_14980 [Telmatospirillum sp.]|nr:hypothetical protein [Telmatospirillum sp.]
MTDRSSRPTASRDVPPGTSWAFRDHRTMAEILAEEAKQKQAA